MKEVRVFARLALAYLVLILFGFLLYIGLIRSPLLGNVGILFYRGFAIAIVAALLVLVVLYLLRTQINLEPPTIVGAVALSLAFNICFLIVFPVTFDRSITMFLLARIEQRDGQLTAPMLERRFVTEYLGTLRQIDRRVEEQRLSGNIRVGSDGRIMLTRQGHRLMTNARRIGGWFDTDPRFIAPQAEPQAAH